MKTLPMNRVAFYIRSNYGFAFYAEFRKWRNAGFGMGESLNRIRTAHAKGWTPIA